MQHDKSGCGYDIVCARTGDFQHSVGHGAILHPVLVPEKSLLVFDISKQMLANIFQQQQSQLQLPTRMTVPIALTMLLMR